jgi:hypothetical protein
MLSFKSAFAPVGSVDPNHLEVHIEAIRSRVAAALALLPASEDSPLMPRWEIGLAKELVS